jgi:hypothetical protein
VPTYSYIAQKAPHPKQLILSHPPPSQTDKVRVRVRDLQSQRSIGRPVCFRCGDHDHHTTECRNALVCFSCGHLNHHSHQCHATTMFQPLPPKLTPKTIAQANALLMLKFYLNPTNKKFHNTIQNCIVLHDELTLGPIYIQTPLQKQFHIPC